MSAAKKLVYAEDRRSGIEWPSATVPFVGGTITIIPQEEKGDFVFSTSAAKVVYSPAFGKLFGDNPSVISHVIFKSMEMVHKAFRNPDYLQTFIYEASEFSGSESYWAIHDGEHITFLLPEDYS